MHSNLKSDCNSLYPQVKALIDSGIKITALRDATRGGVSAVLNEWAKQSNICIEIEEENIPVSDEVKGIFSSSISIQIFDCFAHSFNTALTPPLVASLREIGRASCRERV